MAEKLGPFNAQTKALQDILDFLNTPEGRSAQAQGRINGKADAAFHIPRPPTCDGSVIRFIEREAYIDSYAGDDNVGK